MKALRSFTVRPHVPEPLDALEHLASNLYMPVEAMTLDDVFDLSKAPELQDTAQQQRFFLTLGAALRHEEVHL